MSMEQVLQMILHIIYMITGTYTVILDSNDCQHSDTNTVIVRPNPFVFVSDSVCVGYGTSISDPSYQTISGTIMFNLQILVV